MSLRQRSLTLGLYAVVAWLFRRGATARLLHSRQAPAD